MNFNSSAQKKFQIAGWQPNRDISSDYTTLPRFSTFPQFLKDFLKEYGNLEVLYHPYDKKDNLYNRLVILPEFAQYEDEGIYMDDLSLLGIEIFPFAYINEGVGYLVGCDSLGKVYMMSGSDGYFLRGNSFQEGIEKILSSDWAGSMEWDEENKKWAC